MLYLLSPDDVTSVMSAPFFSMYWPLLAGGLVAIVFLVRGYTKTTIPVVAVAILIQAWHAGFFGAK